MAGDEHASAVAVALQRKGVAFERWVGADLPTEMEITHSTSSTNEAACTVREGSGKVITPPFTSVWNRRLVRPFLPTDWLENQDKAFARLQLDHFWRITYSQLGDGAVWANGFEAANRAKNKVRQLSAAVAVGFRIPETIISNSPSDIRRFIAASPKEGSIVFKSFTQARWREGDDTAVIQTTKIGLDDLPSDIALRACPGIFQHYIVKRSEVRAYFLGASAFSIEIDSQIDARGQVDWRGIPGADIKAVPLKLPAEVHARSLEAMRMLGIITASFDFIITPSGEYIFLEINEAGQFLWIERLLPHEMPLLDATTRFLTSPSANFQWSNDMRTGLSLCDPVFDEAWQRDWLESASGHVHRPMHNMADTEEVAFAYRRKATQALASSVRAGSLTATLS